MPCSTKEGQVCTFVGHFLQHDRYCIAIATVAVRLSNATHLRCEVNSWCGGSPNGLRESSDPNPIAFLGCQPRAPRTSTTKADRGMRHPQPLVNVCQSPSHEEIDLKIKGQYWVFCRSFHVTPHHTTRHTQTRSY
jgi:hypothetical protein